MSRTDREDQGKTVTNPVKGFVTLQSVQAKSEREKEDRRTNRPCLRTTQENVGVQTRGKAAAQDEYSPQPFAPGDGLTQKAQGKNQSEMLKNDQSVNALSVGLCNANRSGDRQVDKQSPSQKISRALKPNNAGKWKMFVTSAGKMS